MVEDAALAMDLNIYPKDGSFIPGIKEDGRRGSPMLSNFMLAAEDVCSAASPFSWVHLALRPGEKLALWVLLDLEKPPCSTYCLAAEFPIKVRSC